MTLLPGTAQPDNTYTQPHVVLSQSCCRALIRTVPHIVIIQARSVPSRDPETVWHRPRDTGGIISAIAADSTCPYSPQRNHFRGLPQFHRNEALRSVTTPQPSHIFGVLHYSHPLQIAKSRLIRKLCTCLRESSVYGRWVPKWSGARATLSSVQEVRTDHKDNKEMLDRR